MSVGWFRSAAEARFLCFNSRLRVFSWWFSQFQDLPSTETVAVKSYFCPHSLYAKLSYFFDLFSFSETSLYLLNLSSSMWHYPTHVLFSLKIHIFHFIVSIYSFNSDCQKCRVISTVITSFIQKSHSKQFFEFYSYCNFF